MLGIIILPILIIIIIFFHFRKNDEVLKFSMSEYEEYIDDFSVDMCVEEIHTSEEAKEVAKEIWIETYGKSVLWNIPYIVSYDEYNCVWLVEGTFNGWGEGGVPYLLIKDDGRIIAVWHTK